MLILGCYVKLKLVVPNRAKWLLSNVVVDARRPNSGLSCPRVDLGAGLARLHVSHARLVPQVAHLRVVAALGSVLKGARRKKHRKREY